jgi:hypothetical protein
MNLKFLSYFFPRYPSLRVAYIDEVELPGKEKKKDYYSTLVKASLTKAENSSEVPLDQVFFFL